MVVRGEIIRRRHYKQLQRFLHLKRQGYQSLPHLRFILSERQNAKIAQGKGLVKEKWPTSISADSRTSLTSRDLALDPSFGNGHVPTILNHHNVPGKNSLPPTRENRLYTKRRKTRSVTETHEFSLPKIENNFTTGTNIEPSSYHESTSMGNKHVTRKFRECTGEETNQTSCHSKDERNVEKVKTMNTDQINGEEICDAKGANYDRVYIEDKEISKITDIEKSKDESKPAYVVKSCGNNTITINDDRSKENVNGVNHKTGVFVSRKLEEKPTKVMMSASPRTYKQSVFGNNFWNRAGNDLYKSKSELPPELNNKNGEDKETNNWERIYYHEDRKVNKLKNVKNNVTEPTKPKSQCEKLFDKTPQSAYISTSTKPRRLKNPAFVRAKTRFAVNVDDDEDTRSVQAPMINNPKYLVHIYNSNASEAKSQLRELLNRTSETLKTTAGASPGCNSAGNRTAGRSRRILSEREASVYLNMRNLYSKSGDQNGRKKRFVQKLEERQNEIEKRLTQDRRNAAIKDEQLRSRGFAQLKNIRAKFKEEQVRRFRNQYVTSKVIEHEYETRHKYGLPERLNRVKLKPQTVPDRSLSTENKKIRREKNLRLYDDLAVKETLSTSAQRHVLLDGIDTVELATKDENDDKVKMKKVLVTDVLCDAKLLVSDKDDSLSHEERVAGKYGSPVSGNSSVSDIFEKVKLKYKLDISSDDLSDIPS